MMSHLVECTHECSALRTLGVWQDNPTAHFVYSGGWLTNMDGIRCMISSLYCSHRTLLAAKCRFGVLCAMSLFASARVPVDMLDVVMCLMLVSVLHLLRVVCVQCANDGWMPVGWLYAIPWLAILLPFCACEYLNNNTHGMSPVVLPINALPLTRSIAAFDDGSLLYPLALLLGTRGDATRAVSDAASKLMVNYYVVYNAAIWMRIVTKNRRVSAMAVGLLSALMLARRVYAFARFLHPLTFSPHALSCHVTGAPTCNNWAERLSVLVVLMYILHQCWRQMCVAINPPCPRIRPSCADIILRELPSDGGTAALVLYGHMGRADHIRQTILAQTNGTVGQPIFWAVRYASATCARKVVDNMFNYALLSERGEHDIQWVLNLFPRHQIGSIVRDIAPRIDLSRYGPWLSCAQNFVSIAIRTRDAPLLWFLVEHTNIVASTLAYDYYCGFGEFGPASVCHCAYVGSHECLAALLRMPQAMRLYSEDVWFNAIWIACARCHHNCIRLLMPHLPSSVLVSARAKLPDARMWIDDELRARRRWGQVLPRRPSEASSYPEGGRCVVVNALQLISARRTTARGRELFRS